MVIRKTFLALVLSLAPCALAASADLKVNDITFSGQFFAIGQPLSATSSLDNLGPDAAQNIVFDIHAPAGATLTITSGAGSFDTCQANGATVHCTAASIPNRAHLSLGLTVNPGTLQDGQQLQLTTTATSDTPDPVPANNSNTKSLDVVGPTDLSVGGSFIPYNAGERATVTLTMTNNGLAVAHQLYFHTDMRNYTFYPEQYIVSVKQVSGPPATVQFDTFNKDTVDVSLPSLAPGESVAIELVIQTWSLRASIYMHTWAVMWNNNTSHSGTIDFRVKPDALADLVGIATAPATVFAGNDIPFALMVESRGPSDAEHVSVTWSVPANTSFVSLKVEPFATSYTCTSLAAGSTSGTITCSEGYADWTGTNIEGRSKLTFTVHANATATVTNHATFTSTTPLTNTVDDFSDAVTTVTTPEAAFDGSITITPSASRVRPSSPLSYTINVANAGPGTITNATVALSLPAGFTGTCGASCTIASLAAGASTTFTISGTSPATVGDTTATATLNAAGDTNGANNSASAKVLVQLPADLAVTLTANPPATAPGYAFAATATVRNDGPGPSDATTLTLEGPGGSTPQPSAFDDWQFCTVTPGKVVCTLGTLAAGAAKTIVFSVGQPAANGTYTYRASAANVDDANPANNSATVSVIRTTDCDLTVTAAATPSTVPAGTQLTYDITIHNIGVADPQNATVTDVLPAGSHIVSVSAASNVQLQCNWGFASTTITCPVYGPTTTMQIKATAPPTAGTYTNNVSVSAPNDPVASNNATTSTITVTAADNADLAAGISGPLVAQKPGADYTCHVTIRNDGPSAASNVVLKLTLNNVTLRGVTAAGATCNASGCTLPSIAAGATATFAVNLTAPATAPAYSQLLAEVSNTTNDPNPINNLANWNSRTLATAPDLQLTVSGPSTVAPLQRATYHIEVHNGGDPATTVSIGLGVPKGFFLPAQSAAFCNREFFDGTITTQLCSITSLAPGATVSVDLAVRAPETAGTFDLLASVGSDKEDGNPLDNAVPLKLSVNGGRRHSSGR